MRAIVASSAFLGFGAYAGGAFIPAFIMRTHHLTVAQVGTGYGLASGLSGAISLIFTAWCVDTLAKRDKRWLLGTVVLVMAVLIPISVASFWIADRWLAIAALSVNPAIVIFYVATTIAAMHHIAAPSLRAQVFALNMIATAVAGGFGALTVGALSDWLAPTYGTESLRHALLIVPLFFTLACLGFALAWRLYPSDQANAGRSTPVKDAG